MKTAKKREGEERKKRMRRGKRRTRKEEEKRAGFPENYIIIFPLFELRRVSL